MKIYLIISSLFTAILFTGIAACADKDISNEPPDSDAQAIYGIWSTPKFIANGDSCYSGECLAIRFVLNPDSSYQLSYKVNDQFSHALIRELNDQGNFEFDSAETGSYYYHGSSVPYVRGKLLLISDSLPQAEWDLEWNSLEGLIIQPEDLGFTHTAYIKLRHP